MNEKGNYQRPLRKEEAAVMAGRSLRQLERDMHNRKVRYYKMGKTVTFMEQDIEEYRARYLVKAKE